MLILMHRVSLHGYRYYLLRMLDYVKDIAGIIGQVGYKFSNAPPKFMFIAVPPNLT